MLTIYLCMDHQSPKDKDKRLFPPPTTNKQNSPAPFPDLTTFSQGNGAPVFWSSRSTISIRLGKFIKQSAQSKRP